MAGEFQATLASGMEAGRDPVEEQRQMLRMQQQESLKAQAQQQQVAHRFLQQLGIVKEKEIPPSSEDLMKSLADYGKKNGSKVNFNIAPDATEEQKRGFLTQLHEAYKIPLPKGKSETTFDAESARQLGAHLSSSGEASIAPVNQPKSIIEQANELKQAQAILDKAGLKDYTATTNSKGQAQLKPKSASSETRDYTEKTANSILKGIKEGNASALLTSMGRSGVAAAVTAKAADEGFDLRSKQLEMTGLMQLAKTMNSNQMVQLGTAFASLEKDLPLLKDVNKDFQRSNVKLANKLVIEARTNGIGLKPGATDDMTPDQAKATQKFITQLNLTRDNMAVAFMRGGVPTDQAFKLTADIFNPVLGGELTDAAIDQVQKNLDLRKDVFSNYKEWKQSDNSVTSQMGLTPSNKSVDVDIQSVTPSGIKYRVLHNG